MGVHARRTSRRSLAALCGSDCARADPESKGLAGDEPENRLRRSSGLRIACVGAFPGGAAAVACCGPFPAGPARAAWCALRVGGPPPPKPPDRAQRIARRHQRGDRDECAIHAMARPGPGGPGRYDP